MLYGYGSCEKMMFCCSSGRLMILEVCDDETQISELRFVHFQIFPENLVASYNVLSHSTSDKCWQ
jgi:hypothetical protein